MAKAAKKPAAKKNPRIESVVPRSVGVLHLGSSTQFQTLVNLMIQSAQEYLAAKGSVDTITIEAGGHYANGDPAVLQQHADDLVNNTAVEVIIAAGGPQSALAAMDATSEADGARADLPVVFTTVADPVGLGLVKSLNKPGRNLTGMAGRTSENDPLRLELLNEYVRPFRPDVTKVGALVNPSRQGWQKQYQDLRDKAEDLGLKLVVKKARNLAGIRAAFRQKFQGQEFLGAVVTADAFFNENRQTIISEANNQGIPTIYQWRGFVEERGLMSYGPSITQAYKRAGKYVGRILHDRARPADMACSKPAGFELVINQTTAALSNLRLVPIPTVIGDEEVKLV